MLRLRAKAKVRYAAVLCFASLFGIYGLLQIAPPSHGRLSDVEPKRHKANGDFTRRSFTAKWHDGRGLLNEVSETKKNENIRAKFVKHLEENQLLKKDSNYGSNFYQIKPSLVDNNRIEPREGWKSNGVKRIRERDQPEQIVNIASTMPANHESLGGINGIKSDEETSLVTERVVGYKRKKDRHGKAFRIHTEIPVTKSVDSGYKNMEQRDQKKSNGHFTKEANYLSRRETREVAIQNQNHRPQRKKSNPPDDVINDVTKSNRTIFDPNDHVITNYILHDNEDFMRSLLDESRRFDSYWAPGFPITPEEALIRYGNNIPAWERFEIMHYPKIYFIGLGANKTKLTSNATENYGYDYFHEGEEEGHYKVVPGDHIGYRYEIIKYIGSGTFGAVVLARDWSQPLSRNVALKIMHYDEDDKYIKRELNMMKTIEKNAKNRDYFSRLLATFSFRNHQCLVLELLGNSLHRRGFGPVQDMTLFRRYAHDILMGLYHLKELNMVHADMKPGNIMFLYGKNNESQGQLLKIADFGIGCIPGDKHLFKCPAYYVQTRYYRAPEVIMSLGITPAVDMFSVGVIFSEFLLGSPPFFGETETDHLAAMMEVLGLPPTHMIAKSPRKKVYQRAICYETENGFKRRPYRKPLTKVLQGIDPELFDLIARCLEFDPKLRITPEEALKHSFVTGITPKEKLKTPISMQRFLGLI